MAQTSSKIETGQDMEFMVKLLFFLPKEMHTDMVRLSLNYVSLGLMVNTYSTEVEHLNALVKRLEGLLEASRARVVELHGQNKELKCTNDILADSSNLYTFDAVKLAARNERLATDNLVLREQIIKVKDVLK